MKPTALDAIDQAIAQLEHELADLRHARTIMARIQGLGAPADQPAEDPAPVRRARRTASGPVVEPAGAILEHLASQRDLVKFVDVRKALGLPAAAAAKALASLIAAKKVVRVGWRVGTPATLAEVDDAEGD